MAPGTYHFNASPAAVLLGEAVQPQPMAAQIQFLGNPYGGLGGAVNLPLVTTRAAFIYTHPAFNSNTRQTLKSGTRFSATVVKNGFAQSPAGWIALIDTAQDPSQIPGDGIVMLQTSLKDLAATGAQTDPGSTSGVLDGATLRAVGAALSIVAGDIKGGPNVALALQTAINLALVNSSAASAATKAVTAAAKPLAVAIQVYVAKKRGQALPEMPGDGGGGGSGMTAWTPKKMAMYGAGGLAVIGILYFLLKKKEVVAP
jgi:hypothetical protein